MDNHNTTSPYDSAILFTLHQIPADRQGVFMAFVLQQAELLRHGDSGSGQSPAPIPVKPPPDSPLVPTKDNQQAGNVVLGDVEESILDLLHRVGSPMVGADIADAIRNSREYVKELLGPRGKLRAQGLIGNVRRTGYFITEAGEAYRAG